MLAPSSVAQRIVSISAKRRPSYQYNLGVDTCLVDMMNRLLPFWLLGKLERAMYGLGR